MPGYTRRKTTKRYTTKKREPKTLIQGSSPLDADIDARIRQERKQHIEHAKDAIRQNTGLLAMESYADTNKNLSEREKKNKEIADEYFRDEKKFQERSKELGEKYEEAKKKGETKEMKKLLEDIEKSDAAAVHYNSKANAVLRDFNKPVDKKRKINDEKMKKIIVDRMGADKQKQLAKYLDKSVWTSKKNLVELESKEFQRKIDEKIAPIQQNIEELVDIIKSIDKWVEEAKKKKEERWEMHNGGLYKKFTEKFKKEMEMQLGFVDYISNIGSYFFGTNQTKKAKAVEHMNKEYDKIRKFYNETSDYYEKINKEIDEMNFSATFVDAQIQHAVQKRKETFEFMRDQFYDKIEPIITAHFSKQLLKWKEKSKKSKLGGKTKKKRRRKTKKKRKRTKKRRRKRRTKKRRRRRR
jgi:hypothetical protein